MEAVLKLCGSCTTLKCAVNSVALIVAIAELYKIKCDTKNDFDEKRVSRNLEVQRQEVLNTIYIKYNLLYL